MTASSLKSTIGRSPDFSPGAQGPIDSYLIRLFFIYLRVSLELTAQWPRDDGGPHRSFQPKTGLCPRLTSLERCFRPTATAEAVVGGGIGNFWKGGRKDELKIADSVCRRVSGRMLSLVGAKCIGVCLSEKENKNTEAQEQGHRFHFSFSTPFQHTDSII